MALSGETARSASSRWTACRCVTSPSLRRSLEPGCLRMVRSGNSAWRLSIPGPPTPWRHAGAARHAPPAQVQPGRGGAVGQVEVALEVGGRPLHGMVPEIANALLVDGPVGTVGIAAGCRFHGAGQGDGTQGADGPGRGSGLHGLLCRSACMEQHQETQRGTAQVQFELHHCHAAVAASVRFLWLTSGWRWTSDFEIASVRWVTSVRCCDKSIRGQRERVDGQRGQLVAAGHSAGMFSNTTLLPTTTAWAGGSVHQ